MPRLIAAKPPPQAQSVVSLPLSSMSAMSLVCAVPHFAGLSTWLSEIRRRLDPIFLHEMTLLLDFPDRFMVPQAHPDLSPKQVRFVPSCYIRPYFAFTRPAGALTVFYNCRTTPAGGRAGEGAGLFLH